MQPLLLKQLSIIRMPGLSRGLKKYDDLAKHVNIIFGPNASGKSSTARAIRELIWRQASGEVIASAMGEFDGEQWELKLEGQ
jgi:predicted AAA+ superfamily ATPase